MYHSDVKICVTEYIFERLLKENEKQHKADYLLSPQCMTADKRAGGIVILSWEWVKWSIYLEDVAFVMDFLSRLSNEGYPYSYCRVGEEFDDIEEIIYRGPDDDNCVCDKIGISREIYIDDVD